MLVLKFLRRLVSITMQLILLVIGVSILLYLLRPFALAVTRWFANRFLWRDIRLLHKLHGLPNDNYEGSEPTKRPSGASVARQIKEKYL